MDRKKVLLTVGILLVGILLTAQVSLGAVPPAVGTVIDDFEDGDSSDWGFFGGNNAGGGGGVLADRPYEGVFYLSTGWGGQGTASAFYGGAFKNFDNTAQVTPPADPWFNVWVLNQTDATVDSYTLEITIREDLDGNGWTDGSEDSFRLDTPFSSSSFDDQWTLVSAPLSDFIDLFTGGDGIFNGNLDEVVIVIAGVQGADPSTVEVDFDLFAFSTSGPLAFDEVVFDDMEHGDPFGNGWFSFNGSVGGGGIAANTADLPPANGGVFSLETGWGSGGTPGFYGGFGRTNPTDASGTGYFNFWINPDGSQEYTLEINLQEDDNGDGAINPPDDDEFQFNCVVSAVGPCAIAGGGWQLVSIPLDDFFDDNSFLTGGNDVLDPTTVARGGNGELINIVMAVIGTGSDVTFRTDYWTFTRGPLVPAEPSTVIDDFESGADPGNPCPAGGLPLGFCTFNGAGSSIAILTATTPPAPTLPAVGTPNSVLQVDVDVTSFAGFIHGFSNPPTLDTWIPQDWSTSEGLSLWLYGTGSGTDLFLDILDNRNPGSTTDDAERWTVAFADDFAGWQLLEFPFSSFTRKEIGNGAPNDGFGLFEVHGWAFGTLATSGPRTYYIDEVSLYGVAAVPELSVSFSSNNFDVDEGSTGNIVVELNRPMNVDDPAQVSVDYGSEPGQATPGRDYTPAAGTLTFVNGGPSELSFPLETFDDNKYEGDERVILRLSNFVDIAPGFTMQASGTIIESDPFDASLVDDFERRVYLFNGTGGVQLSTVEIPSSDPLALPGQGAFENILHVVAPAEGPSPMALKMQARDDLAALLPINNRLTSMRIQKAIGRIEQSLNPSFWLGDFYLDKLNGSLVFVREQQAVTELTKVVASGVPEAGAAEDAINLLVAADGTLAQIALNRALLNDGNQRDIERAELQMSKAQYEIDQGRYFRAIGLYRNAWFFATKAVNGLDLEPVSFGRDFAIGQDWTSAEALSFWFYGTNSGDVITLTVKDNRAPDPGPSGWNLVWSDEFDDSAGTPPNPNNWSYEIGDGTVNGIPGWGNDELQYYTDDPANAATDGNGNLVITAREADSSVQCYYGPCDYTSARLISWYKAEFAYGRIESRIQVPDGEAGLWPAFWSLGTDINLVDWPQTGEIDFMEYVSRLPNEIFGTIHGPGYSGGQSFGNVYDFGEPVYNNYHTFAIEWQPDLIEWYVDGILYHTATPADVAPNPWVFNDPVYLLLNLAIGGNFGGAVSPDLTFPQEYMIDYIRVYQGPDTAERWEASFTDSFSGWQQVVIPFASLTRSGEQPAGAPDDGLNLSEVWGYGFLLPEVGPASGTMRIDQVRLELVPPPTEITVTNLNDSGSSSLREALALIADGGTITFDPVLTGGTITLTTGQLTIDRGVTVDASAAAPVTISGGGSSRVIEVGAGVVVNIKDVVIRDGVAAPQGGGILNRGVLSLHRVVVTNNVQNAAGPASFDLGGGGIYNADSSTLNLTDSTVSDNSSPNQPGGGIYGFFNSTVNITSSTVSGNFSGDVAGGLRMLGNANIINSTFSGNTSTTWHGGGIFHTDGNLTVLNSTFTGNIAPAGTASGILVATFGAPASMTLTNSVMEGNGGAFACAIEGGGAATITSGGNNVINDGSCNPIASDQSFTDALLGPLADNGGPTLTHALPAGSPAIDAANPAVCPATDQRGVPRDAACDVGAYEYVP